MIVIQSEQGCPLLTGGRRCTSYKAVIGVRACVCLSDRVYEAGALGVRAWSSISSSYVNLKEMRHHEIRALFELPPIRDIVLDFGHVVKTTSEERGIAMLRGIITTALHAVSIGPV